MLISNPDRPNEHADQWGVMKNVITRTVFLSYFIYCKVSFLKYMEKGRFQLFKDVHV